MKLIAIVVSNAQADGLVEAFLQAGQRVTRLASTGGLLRQGNTTLILGAEEEMVRPLLHLAQEKVPGALAVVLPLQRYERF